MIHDNESFITPVLCYIEGRFMEKLDVLARGFLYKLFKKKTSFFKESVVYPFVQFKWHKKGFFPFNGRVRWSIELGWQWV